MLIAWGPSPRPGPAQRPVRGDADLIVTAPSKAGEGYTDLTVTAPSKAGEGDTDLIVTAPSSKAGVGYVINTPPAQARPVLKGETKSTAGF